MWLIFSQQHNKYFLEVKGSETWGDVLKVLNILYQIPLNSRFEVKKYVVTNMKRCVNESRLDEFTEIPITISKDEDAEEPQENLTDAQKKERDERAESLSSDPPNFNDMVEILFSGGYSKEDSRQALRRCKFDLNFAYTFLSNKARSGKEETTTHSSKSQGVNATAIKYHNSMKEQYDKLTETEKQAIERLKDHGFAFSQCVETYLACEKNEENALKVLLK